MKLTAKEHNKIIGILHLVEGGLHILLLVVALVVVLAAYGVFAYSVPENQSLQLEKIKGILLIVALILFPFFFLFAFIDLIAGWKILKEKPGARLWGIIASVTSLLNFPLGTLIGVYSLWFLFGVEGKQFYEIETPPTG